jgi:hypothetical protein
MEPYPKMEVVASKPEAVHQLQAEVSTLKLAMFLDLDTSLPMEVHSPRLA